MMGVCKDAEVTGKMVASQSSPWRGQGAKLRIYTRPLSPLVIFKDYPLVILKIFLIFFFCQKDSLF